MKTTRRKLNSEEIDCVAGGPNWNQLPPEPTQPPPFPDGGGSPNDPPRPTGGGGSGGGTPIIEIDVGGGEPLPPVQPN